MSNKRNGCLWAIFILLLCGSLLLNVIFVAGEAVSSPSLNVGKSEENKFDEIVVVAAQGRSEQKIALITLRGIISAAEPGSVGISAVDDLKLQLKQAVADEKVKAVVLAIDSPGGEVTASDVIYNAVRQVRDEAKKPVIISMGSVAASGGYYIACGGSWVMAHDTTFTGSIGVIMQTLNYQALFGKVGLETLTFKSGKFKDMLSGSRAVTEEEKEYVQGLVMQTYGKFVGIVAKERNLPEAELRQGLADGRVISGQDAFAAKLIDELGDQEAAYRKAIELGKAPGAAVVRYESGFKLGKLFRMLGQSEKANVELHISQALTPKLESGRLYYLPSFYAQ